MRYKLFTLLSAVFVLASCGVKGNPKPPPVDKPSPVSWIMVKQVGDKGLLIFQHPKTYIDKRPIKEEVSFKIYKDHREINPDIYTSDNTYWFFDSLSDKQQCYEVFAKTSSQTSSPSQKVCITGKKVLINTPAPPSLKNTDDGILIEIPTDETVFIYKTTSPEKFNPLPYTQTQKTFLDTQVQENQTFCYYYTIKIAPNIESDYSKTACITYKDTFPPDPPTRGKLVVNEDGSATLIWQESSSKDTVGYIIFKNSEPLFDIPIKTYYFIDKTYKQGDTYKVYAVDKAKNKSKPLEIR